MKSKSIMYFRQISFLFMILVIILSFAYYFDKTHTREKFEIFPGFSLKQKNEFDIGLKNYSCKKNKNKNNLNVKQSLIKKKSNKCYTDQDCLKKNSNSYCIFNPLEKPPYNCY